MARRYYLISRCSGHSLYAVSGWPFGGPYAAVCAYKIPHRLTAVGLIAGIAPLNRPGATKIMMRLGRLILGLGKTPRGF